MNCAEYGQKAEGFFFDGGFWVGGGIVETIEEHGNAFWGKGLDDLLEVINGDLVSVSVGELGKGSKDPLLEFNHGEMGREG